MYHSMISIDNCRAHRCFFFFLFFPLVHDVTIVLLVASN